ncbi:MAG: hypothetical protein EAX89_16430 [Candidatus Lokiarchaeota archaeon]|nr:hypothetical protein [Candidatus Lokiarchaeota archaeon]
MNKKKKVILVLLLVIGNIISSILLFLLPSIPTLLFRVGEYKRGSQITDMVLSGKYLYLTETVSPYSYLVILDISNPLKPYQVGYYNITNITSSPYTWDIKVIGNLAFLSADTDGLRIINIENLANPFEIGNYVPDSGYFKVATIEGSLAFIKTNYGFSILNISDPTNPTSLCNYSTFYSINGIAIKGNYAYIGSIGANLIRIFDISDPKNPINLINFTTLHGSKIIIRENYAYIGDYDKFGIVDISSPDNPRIMAMVTGLNFVIDMYLYNNYVFLTGGNIYLKILDVNNPYIPIEVAFSQGSTGTQNIVVTEAYIYLATGTNFIEIFPSFSFLLFRIIFIIIMISILCTANAIFFWRIKKSQAKRKKDERQLKLFEVKKDELIIKDHLLVKKLIEVHEEGIIEGGNYIFKIKLKNNMKYNVTDVNTEILTYPKESIKLASKKFLKISKLASGNDIELSFTFTPTTDCIHGTIQTMISFIDEKNEVQAISLNPHEIKLVCGMLEPKIIEEKRFRKMAEDLLDFEKAEGDLKIQYNPRLIFEKLKVLLPLQNFRFVIKPNEQLIENIFIGEFLGFAMGKYSKKEVALRITITGNVTKDESDIKIEGFCQESAMLAPLISEISERIGAKIDRPSDCTKVLELMKAKKVPWTNIEELITEFNWDPDYAEEILDILSKQNLASREIKSEEKGIRYYFPSLIKN